MDERRKTIKALLKNRQEDLDNLYSAQEDLGNMLLSRFGSGAVLPQPSPVLEEKTAAFNELKKIREEYCEQLKDVEEKARRLNHIEEALRQLASDFDAKSLEMEELYVNIGEEAAKAGLAESHKAQIESCSQRVESLEAELDGLTGRKRTNIINWFGSEARALIVKTSIKKQQSALRKQYVSLGEKCFNSRQNEGQPESIINALAAADDKALALSELSVQSGNLKEERQIIREIFGREGGPAKKIAALDKLISGINIETGELYRSLGKLVSEAETGVSGADDGPRPDTDFSPFIGGEERAILNRIAAIWESINRADEEVRLLEAAIKADQLRSEIARWQNEIESHRLKIKNSETLIVENTRNIEEAQNKIKELESILGGESR